jgi:uncharacterized protein (TIGR02271 family)
MITTENLDTILSGNADVIDPSGDKIGSVGQIFIDEDSGQPAWVTVKTGLFGMSESFVPLADATSDGSNIRVSYDKDTVKDAPRIDDEDGRISHSQEDELYRYYGLTGGSSYGGTTDAPVGGTTDAPVADTGRTQASGGGDSMTLSEEQLHVGKEREVTGRVRLRKYIVTENVTRTVPVSHEEVRLEREPITDANVGDALSGPDLTESEHEVTLHAETPVVEKETVPVEKVRLDTDTVTENVPVTEEVRREEVELDSDGSGTTTRGSDGR